MEGHDTRPERKEEGVPESVSSCSLLHTVSFLADARTHARTHTRARTYKTARRYMRSYRNRLKKGDPNLGGGRGWINSRAKREGRKEAGKAEIDRQTDR